MRDFEEDDPLLAGLAALATDAPPGLLDRVAARRVEVSGPIGRLSVAFTEEGIAYVRPAEEEGFAAGFRERFGRPLLYADRPPAGLLPALRSGRAAGLRFDLGGTGEFQREVLLATLAIPKGQVRPYGWLARLVGRPTAAHEVAAALADNPVPVLLPCHRVVRSDGEAGDHVLGATVKLALLSAEGVHLGWVRDLARDGVYFLGSDTTGIVCFPTCHNARRITTAHQRGFRSLGEARAAGYRPCRVCRPGLVTSA
ncbi:methylated-DNA--[protein]-cysteine S-methyltransferase [Sphaerisporangium fuscum]|uniref:methylated-DNA--[protein]-cysteine S-methyltransferase n=1 Tax=Sphaerisporangium fuscum TaxID=2835868 RepID=UPI001BDC0BC4|nr:methylated-DNA--[protein]-cysteine S-methyltransferase [Sphaerisporangium fuscum]